MKQTIILLVFFFFSVNSFSQTEGSATRTPIQRVVLDIGYTPYQHSFKGDYSMKSFNFGLGYEITKRVDFRINLDVNTFYKKPYDGFSNRSDYFKYVAFSVGLNYCLLDDFNFIYAHSKIDLLIKAGLDMDDQDEQQSTFFDISTRFKMRDLAYIGVGYNYHYFGEANYKNIQGIYATFGIEF